MSDPKRPVDPLGETQASLYGQPQPGAPSYAQQLAQKTAPEPPPPPPKRSPATWIVAAVLVTGGAAGIAFAITKLASNDSTQAKGDGKTVGSSDSAHGSRMSSAGSAADSVPGSSSEYAVLVAEHIAWERGTPGVVDKRMFAADVFAFGVDADEVGTGPDAAVRFVKHDLANASRVAVKEAFSGTIGNATWELELLDATLPTGTRRFALSQVIAEEHGAFTVRAWQWSRTVPDQVAYAASRAGTLPAPARIADAHGDPALDSPIRAALSSRRAYVAMMSRAGNALSFGSAGERLEGASGAVGFAHMTAEFALHDGLQLAQVSPDVAWAAANVDFKNAQGVETFRVLLALAREGGAWKIVQGHWSNGFPIPGAP